MTIDELLDRRAIESEVADRKVEALRLAATVGRAREFYEKEVQRGIDRYERALADFEGTEPSVGTESGTEVGENPAG